MHESQGLLFFPEPPAPVAPAPAVAASAAPVGTVEPEDQHARDQALDISESWIVQAPAGAGKTELLTQRFLALLAMVDEPEEILAITFTRAATAEMLGRILSALNAARRQSLPQLGEARTAALARAALRQSDARGWQLLEQPHRLDVQTIDSLCMQLAHGQPLLARLGGRLQPTDQAFELYALAAERTFARLGSAPQQLEESLRQLLLLRDNNLAECQRLIAGMLACREQWRHVFVLTGHESVDWTSVRSQLEAPLARAVEDVLQPLHALLAGEPALVAELLELARYASANSSRPAIGLLDGLRSLPTAGGASLEHWGALHALLLTQGSWRRTVSLRDGFPVRGSRGEERQMRDYKQRMEQLLARLAAHPESERLRALLSTVPDLPAAHYDEVQWQTLLSVFRVLRHSAAELHVVFAERDTVDFPELSIAAATLLEQEPGTHGLLASEVRRHLLIDEFQDTSRRQHQLIGRLLREWQPGDGRTCFLVGDPMQSIYIFRQAEVELFGRVQRHGLDCGAHTHPCRDLTLSQNFRSHAGLVDPLNRYFEAIFAARDDAETDFPPGVGASLPRVPFSPSKAAAPALPGDSVQVHAFFHSRDPAGLDSSRDARIAHILTLVEQQLPHIEAARLKAGASYTVAVLGRARTHLAPIAAALRSRGIPFRAVELEKLAERQEILDLLSLLRALLHPADRIAWLSVLRAPWCGLTLHDLHTLTGADDRSFRFRPVAQLIRDRAHLLTPDGQARLSRVIRILDRAAFDRFRPGHAHSLAAWLERAWTSLGAPAWLEPEQRENAELLFDLLADFSPDGLDVLDGTLDAALTRFCATPNAAVSETCGVQLMTIHKAKGLGFDVVIVPALERSTGTDSLPLVTMLERARRTPGAAEAAESAESADEVLIAPLGRRGEQHRTYRWVQSERSRRQSGERKRLFYVACTRARRLLHLVGSAEVTSQGELRSGTPDSLLTCAWPALRPLFEQQHSILRGMVERPDSAGMPSQPASTAVIAPPGTPLPPQPGILDLAAHATSPAAAPLQLTRVPSGFAPSIALQNVTVASTYRQPGSSPSEEPVPLERPEGSFEQRARGTALHAMLELVSEAWARGGSPGDPGPLAPQLSQLARATLSRAGLAPAKVQALTATLVPIAIAAASHPEGRWILSPHPEARSEWSFSSWTADGGRVRTLRVDRTFRAGSEPGSYASGTAGGSDCLWIIDYKTGADPGSIALDAYVEAQKEQWRPQLEEYGAALRPLHPESLPLRYALYFPELLRFKSWQ